MMAVPVTPLPEHFNTLPLPLSEQLCRPFSFAEILSATNNFDDSLVIGHGGFGKVYKGVIDNGASIVAIKRLSSASKQGDSEFRTEMEMLSKFRHSHIVSLIGYCYSSTEMILVYEYMVNGSLADQLHKIGKCGTNSNLSWVQRLKICLGAARGLDYLHTGTGVQNSVIHCDMKSSNILLDKNCAAKVSDFGLSRINPIDQSCTHISTNVKGTTGYMDPEYMLTFRLTMKSDVYSFGVVLFEVLCGRRAVDFTLAEEQWSLARWAQCCIEKGTLHRIINPNLWLEILPESLTEFVRIANQCLCYWPKKRPTMTQVVGSLELALALQLGHRDSSAFEMEIICTSEADEIIKNVDSTVVQEEMQPFKFLTVDDASEKQIAMEPLEMAINGTKQVSPDHLPFARSYQLEVLEKAIKQNTVVFLETGSGKTLIAIMLLRHYAYLLRKPSPYIAVFLVPTVDLVTQQAEAVKTHTDLKVGKYWGKMGVYYWDAATWKKEQDEYEVLVMTPMILLNALRLSHLKLEMIRVLIFDECHHAKGKHPYACIMKEFYHRLLATKYQPPRIFGMTASPVKAKGSGFELDYWKQIRELENLMNSKVV